MKQEVKDVLDCFLDDDNGTRESFALEFIETREGEFYNFVYDQALEYYENDLNDELLHGGDKYIISDLKKRIKALKKHRGRDENS